jgi:hypothetical protein
MGMSKLMVPVQSTHLILVVEAGLGQAGPGRIVGLRSKKMVKALQDVLTSQLLAPVRNS